jgi:hypothetical protein
VSAKRRHALRQRRTVSLSRAETAWLTGVEPPDLTAWDRYFLWSLRRGFPSYHRGRRINARELLEHYGDAVPEPRRRELAREVAAMPDHDRRGAVRAPHNP